MFYYHHHHRAAPSETIAVILTPAPAAVAPATETAGVDTLTASIANPWGNVTYRIITCGIK